MDAALGRWAVEGVLKHSGEEQEESPSSIIWMSPPVGDRLDQVLPALSHGGIEELIQVARRGRRPLSPRRVGPVGEPGMVLGSRDLPPCLCRGCFV